MLDYSFDELCELVKEGKLDEASLNDGGICPTCFNRESNGLLFGDDPRLKIYEDDIIECFYVGRPRCDAHIVIISKEHFKDMSEITDELCDYTFKFSRDMMKIIKEVYHSESVYLCTMCDGPMNHFHVQLIPRYDYEKRGSKNFVKERHEFVYDEEKKNMILERLKNN